MHMHTEPELGPETSKKDGTSLVDRLHALFVKYNINLV